MTLAADEFIRRFLIHVLPKGLHRIRHYGLLAGGAKAETLAKARELLAVPAPTPPAAADNTTEPPALARPCPCCGGRMFIIETFEPGCQPRYRPPMPVATIRIDTS